MNEMVPIRRDDAHDIDFVAWTERQVALLRAGRFAELDLDNVIEEIGDLGRSIHSQLAQRLEVLIAHLLKLTVSEVSDPRRGWLLTVNEQRGRIRRLVEENPSLRPRLANTFERAWRHGVQQARGGVEEYEAKFVSGVPTFSVEDALDDKFEPSNLGFSQTPQRP